MWEFFFVCIYKMIFFNSHGLTVTSKHHLYHLLALLLYLSSILYIMHTRRSGPPSTTSASQGSQAVMAKVSGPQAVTAKRKAIGGHKSASHRTQNNPSGTIGTSSGSSNLESMVLYEAKSKGVKRAAAAASQDEGMLIFIVACCSDSVSFSSSSTKQKAYGARRQRR
jgi:hypothetical protein